MNAPSPDELDAADMRRLGAGQDAALNDLMERHGEKVFHYLIRCLHNDEEAADLAQEAFVRIYQHRANFDAGRKFSTWLYAIVVNLVKDRYRWRSRHPQLSLDAVHAQTGEALIDHLNAHEPTPSDILQADERAEAVRRAVDALPDDLRTPLILAAYEECSQAEIGEILGCTVKAVETRLYRARQQLRSSLAYLLEMHRGVAPPAAWRPPLKLRDLRFRGVTSSVENWRERRPPPQTQIT